MCTYRNQLVTGAFEFYDFYESVYERFADLEDVIGGGMKAEIIKAENLPKIEFKDGATFRMDIEALPDGTYTIWGTFKNTKGVLRKFSSEFDGRGELLELRYELYVNTLEKLLDQMEGE